VPVRVCHVAFKSPSGVSHSVEVEAETLMEAAGLGLAKLKKDGWIEGLGPATQLEITARTTSTHHTLSVKQLQNWVGSTSATPADTLRKAKIKHLLGY
jgi:hypothetical protein